MSIDEDMLYESLHESWNEIEELKAENTRLREQNYCLMKDDLLHWLTDATAYEQHEREREMQASTAELQAENAKLRELVRDMWTCIQTADKSDNAWDECPRCSLWNGNNNHRCEFDRRMKELGVEA